jgi:uncharacterized damage-inducible protein DinB
MFAMTWTAPDVERPGGSLNSPEAELLRGLLDFHRATLLRKCAGLTAEQLATAPYPHSNLTLLGLIRHLAKVERIWFRRRFRGEPIEMLYSTPEWKDADFEDIDASRAEAEYRALLDEQDASRRAVAGAALDETFDQDGEPASLRFVLAHMIGEYARHNGHADFLRQGIDGVTGA